MSPAAAPPGGPAPRVGLAALRELGKAEDFFEFFELPFDPRVVSVFRLHILKRFALEMAQLDREHPALDEAGRLALYRDALRRSHDVFRVSTAQQEKLFRVFGAGEIVTLTRRGP